MASTGYYSGFYFVSQQTTQRNPALSLKAQALHALVLGMPDDYCVWHADLRQRTGWGKDKTTNAIAELVACGLWVRDFEQPKRGQCRYRVRETLDTEIPDDLGPQRIFRVRDEAGDLAYPWEDWGYLVERRRFWGSGLDLETAWALEILLGWPESWRANITMDRLATCFADGRRTAQRILATLTEAGHLHRIQGRDPGGAFRWVTEVTAHPSDVARVFDFEAERAVRRPAYLVDQARVELGATGTDDFRPVRVSRIPIPVSIGMPLVLGDETVHTYQSETGTPVLCAERSETGFKSSRSKEGGSNVVDFDATESRDRVRGRARRRSRGRRRDRLTGSDPDPVGDDPIKEAEDAEKREPLGEHYRKQVRGRKSDATREYADQPFYGSFVHPDSPPRTPPPPSDPCMSKHPSHRNPGDIAYYFQKEARRLGFTLTDVGLARSAEFFRRWMKGDKTEYNKIAELRHKQGKNPTHDGDRRGPSAWEIHYMIDRFFEESAGRKDEIFDSFREFTKRSEVLEHEARRAIKARRQRVTPHRLREEQQAEERKRAYIEEALREQYGS